MAPVGEKIDVDQIMASEDLNNGYQPTVPQIAAVRPPSLNGFLMTRAGVGIKRHDDETKRKIKAAEKGAEATQDLANDLKAVDRIERLINGIDKQVMTQQLRVKLVTDMVNDGEVHKEVKYQAFDGDVDNEDSLLRQVSDR
ncbi:hypothetical protein SPFM8_00058 [Salmonella phage SPFM8]|nr:hypothetical protein SPFM8_00058 [Salmonella phage SPFM8]